MPLNCCVPQCTKKGYRTSSGDKISYFGFPKRSDLSKKWILAIRRDPGKEFQITELTKVCSRHFKETDLKKSLNGKVSLKEDTVPSKFPWTVSPLKRKTPAVRITQPAKAKAASHEGFELDHPRTSKSLEDDLREQSRELEERNSNLQEKIEGLERELNEVKVEKERLKNKNSELAAHLETERRASFEGIFFQDQAESESERKCEELAATNARLFKLENLNSDENIVFYTGFPNYETFMAMFTFLNTGTNGENVRYCSWARDISDNFYDSDEDELEENNRKKQGRPRKIKPLDEFFLTMCRLRRGFSELHLANLFGVSQATVSRIFISFINYMFLKFAQVNIWPSREIVEQTMPAAFKEKYPSTRIIIDCTEIRCEMPRSLLLNSELFSSYKNHVTFKALVGIAPSGAVTFISQLYAGSISDREIVTRSGFLDQQFNEGDSVMADKGFTIQDLLPLGVSLNIPPFLGTDVQMSQEDIIKTQQIASVRIHIERAINRIKNYQIWNGVVPLSLIGVVNQMWSVCAFLCNAQDPLISA